MLVCTYDRWVDWDVLDLLLACYPERDILLNIMLLLSGNVYAHGVPVT
ncbi:hypothetical protein LPH50_02050 [Xylella taiwanensis]|uniref:Uncharacterized protein n=1 Tax=Xylella taiwanensis TaxID=1444770 RepID=Z9JHX9_9GAMM|nr:hypothetical protein [Xylella taiwanensis]EWS77426.1 hypothetical protein AF72_10790 [Xylella taiwanensis]MCD8457022.1 hypothetical protein [Xylella taiwanensis]MCD8459432.1 hypothetical protein [Xylella taiwanensis]MCD8461699.1 hypothetical protein [Xylella taiwanensis]MCD8462272.1 hypothetical protein [Xylella taiwanensis]